MNRLNVLLFGVLILAFILRFVMLDKFPAGLNADEAAIGYNAYSLIMTGKDEYGERIPLIFKSFGDYKPGLYFYMVLPFVAVLGLNEWAVRIPSALFGIGTVVLLYFLAKEIFKNRLIGLIAAFILTITPWHIHFSRGGWESNVATFFITLGVYLFVKSRERKYFFFSMLAFLISMYIYQSPRLIAPLLALGLIFIYRKEIVGNFKIYLRYILILVVLTIPLAMQILGGGIAARFSGLSFLSDSGPFWRMNELRGEHNDLNSPVAKILHNKVYAYSINFVGHYLDHFRSDFLFINGDEVIRNKVPETGQIYLAFSVFLFTGVYLALKGRKREYLVILLWVVVAPLAASLTFQTPSALRAHSLMIPLVLIMAFGAGRLLTLNKRYSIFIGVFMILFLGYEVLHYSESYLVHYPKRYPQAWEYGFSEMVGKMERIEKDFEKVVITDKYDQPYILVLFYKKYDPLKYQPQAKLTERDKYNFGTVRSFDKYEFRSIKGEDKNAGGNVLYIGIEKEVFEDAKIIDRVKNPDGSTAFVFFKT